MDLEDENPAFSYHYSTNLYNPEHVIQEKYLGFEPESLADCAALCNKTIGGMCKVGAGWACMCMWGGGCT
jgi:hypothetical protein